MRYPILLVFSFILACGSTPPKPEVSTTLDLATIKVDGNERLEKDVIPTHYTLQLKVDPSKDKFSGQVAIKVKLENEKQVIKMHAEEMNISKATIKTPTETLVASVVEGENNGIALVLDKPIPASQITIELTFSAPLDETPTGLYRVKEGGQWYAFTQFEPLEARQAFPCFDEPGFKTPFKTTIEVPKGQIAVSNTPLENDKGGQFSFVDSKPLPTYLIAFAIGEFDVVAAGEGAIEGVPFRVLTTKGKGKLADYMLQRTPRILATLSDYFGKNYPYKKLDVIAVPNFSAGAMENAGLVTFRETLLLLDPARASIRERRSAVSVMAHELAHMWFGDLVTMEWWDDLWLNEAFATWMARKVVQTILPTLEVDIDAINTRSWVMSTDSQAATRSIRQPITNGGDVYNAFDGLTYQKGAAVIEMFESWVGDEKFQEGVRNYLVKYAYDSATTDQFLAEIDNATDMAVGDKLKTFLDQPGVPLLDMSLTCTPKEKPEGDKKKTITISIAQSRYLPHGSKAKAGTPWSAPFCVRYDEKREVKVHCDIIDAQTKDVQLDASSCPKWYYPNADESGYYLWNMPAKDLQNLTNRYLLKLSKRERVGLFSNINALLSAHIVNPDTYVKTVKTMAKEKHRSLLSRTMSAMISFDRILGEEGKKTSFSRRARALLTRHMNRIGYKKRNKEAVEITIIRPRMLSTMAKLEDKKALRLAAKLTTKYFKDPSSVPGDLLGFAFSTTARSGDEAMWNQMKSTFDKASNPSLKRKLISALGSFRDPVLREKSLALFLDGTFRSQDFYALIGPMFHPDVFPELWAWFTTNYDAIVTILGEKSALGLPRIGGGFCDTEGKEKVSEFFSKKSGRLQPGGERTLTNTLDGIGRCMSERAYLKAAVLKFSK